VNFSQSFGDRVGGIFLSFNQDVWQAVNASGRQSRGLEYFSAPNPNSFSPSFIAIAQKGRPS